MENQPNYQQSNFAWGCQQGPQGQQPQFGPPWAFQGPGFSQAMMGQTPTPEQSETPPEGAENTEAPQQNEEYQQQQRFGMFGQGQYQGNQGSGWMPPWNYSWGFQPHWQPWQFGQFGQYGHPMQQNYQYSYPMSFGSYGQQSQYGYPMQYGQQGQYGYPMQYGQQGQFSYPWRNWNYSAGQFPMYGPRQFGWQRPYNWGWSNQQYGNFSPWRQMWPQGQSFGRGYGQFGDSCPVWGYPYSSYGMSGMSPWGWAGTQRPWGEYSYMPGMEFPAAA